MIKPTSLGNSVQIPRFIELQNHEFQQKVLEKPYNDFTKDWVMSDYKATMQYWVYDYKNVLGIVNRGQLPDMDEKGPYGYR